MKSARATFSIEQESSPAGFNYVLSLRTPQGKHVDLEIIRSEDDCYNLAVEVFEQARRKAQGVNDLLDQLMADVEAKR